MPGNEAVDGCHWRVSAYKDLGRRVNDLFSSFLSDYCCNCQQVISRLPEAQDDSFDLVEGVYPGCCHRGAGDIFRLENQTPGRSHLAPEIIDGLQQERRLLMQDLGGGAGGGTYLLRRHRDDTLTRGAHCQYFTDKGCSLGVLKGPLCINFICPPLRSDLLEVCADAGRELVGPEPDFLFIYRTLAIISYDSREKVMRELALLERRLADLGRRCRKFLLKRGKSTIYENFKDNNYSVFS